MKYSAVLSVKNQYGTPSYPSPLDRIRNGRIERALQLGLSPKLTKSFEFNQSFPLVTGPQHFHSGDEILDMGDIRRSTLDKFKGDALNSFSFSAGCCKGSFSSAPDPVQCPQSLSGSWVFYNFVGGGHTNSTFPVSVRNPNKAIVIINARTTEVLVANKMTCQLLGFSSDQLSGKYLCDFFTSRKEQYALTETELESSGKLVVISGKVMDLTVTDKDPLPVSVWMRKLPASEDPRCLVVMEPVQRATASVTFNSKGKLLNYDNNLAILHGYLMHQELQDLNITDLIPSLVLPSSNKGKLPQEIRKQQATGRTQDGVTFPLSILIERVTNNSGGTDKENELPGSNSDSNIYHGIIWVFANISGMITVLPDGTIHSCNTNFSLMLFGYSQEQIVGKPITLLIPTFYDDLEFLDTDSMPLPLLDDDDEDAFIHCCCASDGRTTAESLGHDPPRPMNPLGKHIELMIEGTSAAIHSLTISPTSSEIQKPSSACPKIVLPFSEDESSSPCSLPISKEQSSNPLSPVQVESLLPLMSSHCCLEDRFVKTSESQETLHSFVDTITESDINGNILDTIEKQHVGRHHKKSESEERKTIRDTKAKGDCSLIINLQESVDGPTCQDDDKTPVTEIKLPMRQFELLDEDKVSCSKRFPSSFSAPSVSPNFISCSKSTEDETLNKETAEDKELEVTSTPKGPSLLPERLPSLLSTHLSNDSLYSIPEGNYFGMGRHRDGSDLTLIYQIRKVDLDDGKTIYCLWVSRDPEEAGEGGRPCRNLTLASSINSTSGIDTSTANPAAQFRVKSCTLNNSSSFDISDLEYVSGQFSEKYTTLQQIGKGAFGCVKMSYRNCDGLLVITKFIKKVKVYEECWVYDSILGCKVPLEISLLYTLRHPNIVQVLDVFENDNYFQMVMEKHGAGMDLFEFIDRSPKLDEPLASYLFRQIVSALNYLHSVNILHRDVKDENIIIDQHFHLKLIDFGSAAFMGPDRYFSTFCGTMEYCSPEVIQGNKYQGPELEMWALGVTLYTLVFGENPFYDEDETIAAILRPPFKVSQDLMHLISMLLQADVEKRFTLPEVTAHPWTVQPVNHENYKFEDVVHANIEEINPPKYMQADKSPVVNMSSFDNIVNSAELAEHKHQSTSEFSSHSHASSLLFTCSEDSQQSNCS